MFFKKLDFWVLVFFCMGTFLIFWEAKSLGKPPNCDGKCRERWAFNDGTTGKTTCFYLHVNDCTFCNSVFPISCSCEIKDGDTKTDQSCKMTNMEQFVYDLGENGCDDWCPLVHYAEASPWQEYIKGTQKGNVFICGGQ